MNKKEAKKILVKEVKDYISNEQEKERQKLLWGMCIVDHKDKVLKIEDITDKEWADFMKGRKDIIKYLKTPQNKH
jgi:diadenosine tetraphosphate (Ap4A) HIT family hydrolase